jgi:hypothetical protein
MVSSDIPYIRALQPRFNTRSSLVPALAISVCTNAIHKQQQLTFFCIEQLT